MTTKLRQSAILCAGGVTASHGKLGAKLGNTKIVNAPARKPAIAIPTTAPNPTVAH
jgi:hypothetical protein